LSSIIDEARSLDRHAFRSTEAELYRYPAYVREHRLRKRYLEDLATSHVAEEPVDGGPMPIPDIHRAVVRADEDRRLKVLECKIGAIEEAMELLRETRPEHWRLCYLKYFRGRGVAEVMAELNVSQTQFFRMRRSAIEQVAPLLFGPFGECW
jgi:hypothetical protein